MRLSPWVNLLSSPCTPDSGSVSAMLTGKWLSAGFLAGLLPMDQGNQMPQRRLCLWTCVRAVALEIQSGPGSHAMEELQEILAYVEHKALVPRKTHHTLDVASFPSEERWCIGWLSSDRILEKIKRKVFFFFVVVFIRILKISGCGCLVLLILVSGKAGHHAWSVWQRKTFYLTGARTQRRMESHHLLQSYASRWHHIIPLAPTSWCFCHCQITKPFTWDFGNIPDPNSNT